jgi:homocysteine S-methyltransferase
MHNPIEELLAEQPFVIIDGALATELESRGCDLNDPLWSASILIEQPEQIEQLHADYLAAGADIVITASYQASYNGFAQRGYDTAQATVLMQRSVELARNATQAFTKPNRPRPLVAASIGPYGAYLHDGSEYRGNYGVSDHELRRFHRPRMAALIEAGADLLACETIPSLHEAHIIAELLGEFPQIGAWFSFSARDGEHTCEGQRIADAVAELSVYPQIFALGVNCTAPEHITSLLDQARPHTNKPLIVYPNSGEQYDIGRKCWLDHTGASWSSYLETWYQHGARLIGGCCRTRPSDIAQLAALRQRLQQNTIAEV